MCIFYKYKLKRMMTIARSHPTTYSSISSTPTKRIWTVAWSGGRFCAPPPRLLRRLLGLGRLLGLMPRCEVNIEGVRPVRPVRPVFARTKQERHAKRSLPRFESVSTRTSEWSEFGGPKFRVGQGNLFVYADPRQLWRFFSGQ